MPHERGKAVSSPASTAAKNPAPVPRRLRERDATHAATRATRRLWGVKGSFQLITTP
jgi:hypothetical protein